ncbi:MAG: hypothetical protein NT180_08850 [Actinobacteria bacterium]|nr:hypothetical protein [Actinomycetota bacterium]
MKRTSRIAVAALAATGAVAGATAAIAAPAWFNPAPDHGSTIVADASASVSRSAAPATSDTNAVPVTDASASAVLAALKQREQELRDQLAAQSAEAQGNGETVVSNQTSGATADPTQDSQTTNPQESDSQTPSPDVTPTTDPSQGPVVVKPQPRPPAPHSSTGASGG